MAAILFSFAGSCIRKLQEIITEEALQILGVKQDLRELQETMIQIQCFLRDADRRRFEDLSIRNWLDELRDAMYDADDIIDLVRFKGSSLLGEDPKSSRKSIACNGFPLFSCISISTIHIRHNVSVHIRRLNKRIERISELGKAFKFEMKPIGNSSVSNTRQTSCLVEPNLVGNEIIHATTRLAELVLQHKKKVYKIGIVGTGGAGKTLLAQKLYNDKRVKVSFQKQAWICVSQQYSEVALLKEILRNFGVYEQQGESVGELKAKIAEVIEENSIFVVLDDLWESDVWTDLLRIPLDAAAQAIIVVTTRHDTVAHAIGVEHMHRVELMSEDVGWELLWKSMNINNEKELHHLRDTGLEIVRKCGGLPLGIRIIARVLTTKEATEIEWRKILSNDAWRMNKLPAELCGALYLSYDQLHQYLKQCFLYCALYPEDWTMNRDDLVRSWVAEGFIEKQENQLLEDTAEEYYYELISRNLLLPDPLYFDQVMCRMHDLLRQLGHHLLREESFLGDPQLLKGRNLSKLRHVSVITDKDVTDLPNVDKQQLRVRTFISFCGSSLKAEPSIFKRLSHVRVLDFSGSSIQTIPDHIGSLIHLRLFNLNNTNIICLPESIGSLKNLQVLNLRKCDALFSLPLAVSGLCNLRRLALKGTPINKVPNGIGRLEFLNDLDGFPIGASHYCNSRMQDGWNIEELEHLLQLRQLRMVKLERAASCAANLLLTNKKHLKVLYLRCTDCAADKPYCENDVNNIKKLFEKLTPPPNLEDLHIKNFFGQSFPIWLGSGTHLSSLKYLQLKSCNSCVHLPPIGQLPNLKYLRIRGAASVTKIGPEFVGYGRAYNPRSVVEVAFPKLEWLIMEDMHSWEEWTIVAEEDGRDAFPVQRMQLMPRLKELFLGCCPKLKALPWHLGQAATSLKELHLRNLSSLKTVQNFLFLSEDIEIIGCEDLERVSNLPRVRVMYAQGCPNLWCVEKLENLQQLWLDDDMQEASAFWLHGVRRQLRHLNGEDLDTYIW